MAIDEEVEVRYILNCLNVQYFDQHPKIVQFENRKIISLKLSRKGLTHIPYGIFDNLVNLRELDLSNNYIEKLPSGIFEHLTELRVLYLHHNYISELPHFIFDKLSNLKELMLHNNKLYSIENNLFSSLHHLCALNLSNNQLQSLPTTMSELSNLDWLDLRKNRLEEQYNVKLTDNIKIQSLLDIYHKSKLNPNIIKIN